MKNLVVSCFFLSFIASCASTGDVSQWQGASFGSVIEEYGTPNSYLKLSDGSKVVEYDNSASAHLSGNYCSLTFMLDRANKVLGAKANGNGINCVN